MKNETLHNNVLTYDDWPQVPRNAPQQSDPGLDIHLADAVREFIGSVRQDIQPALSERRVHIRNFRSDRYKLLDDLVISLEETDDGCVARSYDTGQYGLGVSADDAIEHLCSVLEDYYDLLQEERGNLSRPLESHLRYLDTVLKTR